MTIKVSNIEAVTNALEVALEKYPNAVLYGEDAGFEGGVFRATKGLQAKFGAARVFDSQICEATMVGSAIGMAMGGLRPIVEIQFEGFSYPALQQLICHASRWRNRTRGRFYCPLVVRMPMGGGIRALEHHSEAIEAIWAHVPGLQVVIPSTPYDTKGLLLAAIASNDPVIFAEPAKTYRAFKQEVPAEFYTVEIGKARQCREGNDLTIVTYGAQVPLCEKVVDEYVQSHPQVSIEIIDLRSIKPWDRELVCASVSKTGRLIVVHEAVRSFSVAAEVIATVNERCFDRLKAPATRVTGYDIVVPFERGEKYFWVTAERIRHQIEASLGYQF